jgi:hypothetical protein
VKNVGKTLCSGGISWNSDQASRLEEKRMLRVQRGSQNILEIKRKKFWMLDMWYITLKKDLWSEECMTKKEKAKSSERKSKYLGNEIKEEVLDAINVVHLIKERSLQ